MANAPTPLVLEKLRKSESGCTGRWSSGPMVPATVSTTTFPW
ncbi:MAG TPA: hypothetical protein VIS76_06130 [Pseudomonadales bacterium]